jgi:hypothetical protein
MYASNDEILVDDISEEVVEEIFNELVEEYISEGYETEEVLDIVEEAALDFIEAKVTYGHDTEAPEKKSMLKGRIRYAKRKAGEAVKAGKEKVKTAAAVGGVAASIAKDEVRRAGRKAQHSVSKAADAARRAPGEAKKKAKSGIKGFIKRQAQKVVSRMSEEAVGEAIDFKGAAREQARRDAIQAAKDKKSPSSKDRRLARGKFRPGASAEERAEGGRDAMREKGTSPTKDGKKMFEELQATGLFTNKEIEAILETQMNEGIIDAAKAGSKRHQDAMKGAGRAIKKAGIRAQKLGKALAPAADTAKSAAGGVAKAAKATYAAGEKTGAFVKKGAQRHNDMMKAAKKVFSKEELELIAQIMIDEGFDISDYTWEEFYTLCVEADN